MLPVLPKTFPTCKFDLNIGQSQFVEHIPHQNGIDTLLKWIIDNKFNFEIKSQQSSASLSQQSDDNISLNNGFVIYLYLHDFSQIRRLFFFLMKRLNTDFVCWRGLLTYLLSTPYDKQSDWMFTVIFYKNTWYLCEVETEKHEKERLNASDQTKKFTYWGHKFETYITSGNSSAK